MKNRTRWAALGLAAALALTTLAGCGGSAGKDAGSTTAEEPKTETAADAQEPAAAEEDAQKPAAEEEILEADADTTFRWLLNNRIESQYYE